MNSGQLVTLLVLRCTFSRWRPRALSLSLSLSLLFWFITLGLYVPASRYPPQRSPSQTCQFQASFRKWSISGAASSHKIGDCTPNQYSMLAQWWASIFNAVPPLRQRLGREWGRDSDDRLSHIDNNHCTWQPVYAYINQWVAFITTQRNLTL